MQYKLKCELMLDDGNTAKEGDTIRFNFLGECIEGVLNGYKYWDSANADCVCVVSQDVPRYYIIDAMEDCFLVKKKEELVLTEDEIVVFNYYLEDAGMDIAFGNSDWNEIYRKIVGDSVSEYAREKWDKFREMYER